MLTKTKVEIKAGQTSFAGAEKAWTDKRFQDFHFLGLQTFRKLTVVGRGKETRGQGPGKWGYRGRRGAFKEVNMCKAKRRPWNENSTVLLTPGMKNEDGQTDTPDTKNYLQVLVVFLRQNQVGKTNKQTNKKNKTGWSGRSNNPMGYSAGNYWWHEKSFFQADPLDSPASF